MPYSVDADRFAAEVEEARAQLAAGRAEDARAQLDVALDRWRGPAGAELAQAAGPGSAPLEDLRLAAEELRLDALLRADGAVEVAPFEEAARAHPGREGVWARYMIALYRDGRVAEALRTYQELRRHLDGEPSDWIVRLERSIVFHDPALRLPTVDLGPLPDQPELASAHRRAVELPAGILTFMMTDVFGSTSLWEAAPEVMRRALVRHDRLVIEAVESHHGLVIRERGEGDSTFSVFTRATSAAAGALALAMSLASEPWPPGCVIRVRLALHVAEASPFDGDYYGPPINRLARIRATGEPGQILLSQAAHEVLVDHLPEHALLRTLGPRELKDLPRPEPVHELAFESSPVGGPVPMTAAARSAPRGRPASGWSLLVGPDRAYFETNDADDQAYPSQAEPLEVPLVLPTVVIGRHSSSAAAEPDLDLSGDHEDPGVSRRHALLERQPSGRYALIDLASTNGTFVNDPTSPIPPGVRTMLQEGDRIYLGNWTCLEVVAGSGA